jgi:RNA polymerase primary sigma factor
MVGSRRLLAAEEEVRLGRLVRRGQLADEELAQIPASRTRRSTRQLETEAARGREAHARFVEANLRLVVSLAHRRLVAAEGVELLDLIQFGNLGLMRAVDKFDPELGYKFSTYATWWVRQHMDRGVADTGRLVRLPVHVVEKLNKVRAATRRLGHSGHIATADAVGALTNLDRATVEYLWAMDRPLVRLDAPVGADSDATLGDVLPVGHMGPGPESLACTAEAHETIRNLLQQHCADSRSVEVIAMRFGLDTDDPMTLDEIGKLYGVTRERIRQIEKKALTALREALSPQEFRDLVEAVS